MRQTYKILHDMTSRRDGLLIELSRSRNDAIIIRDKLKVMRKATPPIGGAPKKEISKLLNPIDAKIKTLKCKLNNANIAIQDAKDADEKAKEDAVYEEKANKWEMENAKKMFPIRQAARKQAKKLFDESDDKTPERIAHEQKMAFRMDNPFPFNDFDEEIEFMGIDPMFAVECMEKKITVHDFSFPSSEVWTCTIAVTLKDMKVKNGMSDIVLMLKDIVTVIDYDADEHDLPWRNPWKGFFKDIVLWEMNDDEKKELIHNICGLFDEAIVHTGKLPKWFQKDIHGVEL